MSNVEVLFFAADPLSAAPDGTTRKLQLEEEVRQIRRKVRLAPFRRKLHFDTHGAARTSDLLDALTETRPQVVHFSGHGGRNGLVIGAADGFGARRVPPEGLKALFKKFPGEIRVVVLNACFSLDQARAISDVVGCAIGAPDMLPDPAAITFASSFYRAIASGRSVQSAFEEGRIAYTLENHPDAQCPQLVCRKGVDPARVFLIPPRATRIRRRVAATLTALMLSSGAVYATNEVIDETTQSERIQTQTFLDLKQRAERGDPKAMGLLGIAYLNGDGVAPNPANGVLWLRQAIKKKRDPAFMNALAGAYEAGNGVNLSLRWARHWYLAAATEKGNAEAMRSLGRLYQDMGSDSTDRQALAWYEKAVQAGSVEAMVDLGVLYQNGRGVPADRDEAERWFRRAAEAGSAHARAYVEALAAR